MGETSPSPFVSRGFGRNIGKGKGKGEGEGEGNGNGNGMSPALMADPRALIHCVEKYPALVPKLKAATTRNRVTAERWCLFIWKCWVCVYNYAL